MKKNQNLALFKSSFWILCTFILYACGGNSPTKEQKNTSEADSIKENKTEKKQGEKAEKNEEEKTEKPQNSKEQVSIGTFVEIEQGDYFHFRIKTEEGEEKSFFVLNDDDTYRTIEANPEKYKGKKVKVYWVAKKQNIPEAGGEMDIDEYIKAELLD
jgi:hypothetical protein